MQFAVWKISDFETAVQFMQFNYEMYAVCAVCSFKLMRSMQFSFEVQFCSSVLQFGFGSKLHITKMWF